MSKSKVSMYKQFIFLSLIGTLLLSPSCLEDPNSNTVESSTINITNQIFTKVSADCSDYADQYNSVVTDIQENKRFDGALPIIAFQNNCTIAVNGIPNHNFNDESANFATEVVMQSRIFTVPKAPQRSNNPTPLSQRYFDAVLLNGVVVDMLSAGCYKPNNAQADDAGNTAIGCTTSDNWLLDPLGTDSKFGADANNAHTQPDGTYHYHGNPNAMFNDEPGADGSPVIGFAADGFPIYGSYFVDPQTNEVRKAVSGYTLKEGNRPGPDEENPGGMYNGLYVDDYEFTDAGDLDACNGMMVNGEYGYYVTDSYPWILACHSGTVHESFNKGQGKFKEVEAWHHEH